MASETKTKSSSKIDPKDEYYWFDFVRETQGKVFPTKASMIKSVLTNINRVFAIVMIGKGCYVKKMDKNDMFNQTDTISDIMDFKWKYKSIQTSGSESEDDKGTVLPMSFKKFVKEAGCKINTYNRIVFKPMTECKNDLNIWSGFTANTLEEP